MNAYINQRIKLGNAIKNGEVTTEQTFHDKVYNMLKSKYDTTTTTTETTTDDDFNQAVLAHLKTFGKTTLTGPTKDEQNFHHAVYAHLTGMTDTPLESTTDDEDTTDN